VKNAPDFISNLRYYPQTVSFLIEKREKVQ
jgi:hypothetical protein